MPTPNIFVSWPGIAEVLDFDYTATIGISPSTALVRAVPKAAAPTLTGNLIFGTLAPAFALTLRDCLVAPNGFREVRGTEGRAWELLILDRRWRWDVGPAAQGQYNQLDTRGKLTPWLVRSPFQLAVQLLTLMGEPMPPLVAGGWTSVIDLPGGLAAVNPADLSIPPMGPFDQAVNPAQEYLDLGQNLAQTGTNPPTLWVAPLTAARALANLCDIYGRVPVWNPITDQASIQRIGSGSGLPAGAVLSQAPSIDPKAVPIAVVAQGSPTRNQVRLACRSVGREWNDVWSPQSELSYAPRRLGQKMIVVIGGQAGAGDYAITINGVSFGLNGTGSLLTLQGLADLINNSLDPAVMGKVFAAALVGSGEMPVLTLTGFKNGYEFDVAIDGPVGGTDPFEMACTHGPVADRLDQGGDNPYVPGSGEPPIPPGVAANGVGFEYSAPPSFRDVVATNRLSYGQARDLAVQSVFRCYQAMAVDPSVAFDLTAALREGVPFPGQADRVRNRFRMILQDSRPDQTTPRPGDQNRIDPVTGQPFAFEVYNGYSKDRRPQPFGSLDIRITTGGKWAIEKGDYFGNTPKRSPFYLDFQIIDPERQVIAFSRPIFRILGGADCWKSGRKFPSTVAVGEAAYLPPDLVIETGCLLVDAGTFAPLRYEFTLPIAGGIGPPRTLLFADIQQEVIGDYDSRHRLIGERVYDADAANRASYYAAAVAATYQLTGAVANTYPGLLSIGLSGLVRQVTWSMGRGGVVTHAAANCEFSPNVIPYPNRRLLENLPPDAIQAAQNIIYSPTAQATTRNAVAGVLGGAAGQRAIPGV